MTITADFQIELDGLLLGAGTPYNLVSIDGLAVPPVRTSDSTLQRRHGVAAGDDFVGGRGVVIGVELLANGVDEDIDAIASALQDVLVPGKSDVVLEFQLPGRAGGGRRRITCRPRAHADPHDLRRAHGIPTFLVEFFAPDPRIYDATPGSVTTNLPTSGSGSSFPWTFPVNFGGTTDSGSVVVTNEGNFDALPVFRIDGPVVNPEIENVTTGETLSLTIDVDAADFLEIDTAAPSVLLNGTASRFPNVSTASVFPRLAPGDNELRFRATTDTAATLKTDWRSAWIA